MGIYLWKNLTLNPSPCVGKGWGEGAKCSLGEKPLAPRNRVSQTILGFEPRHWLRNPVASGQRFALSGSDAGDFATLLEDLLHPVR